MDRSKEGIGKTFSATLPESVSTAETLLVGEASRSRVRLPEMRDRQTTVIFHSGGPDEDECVEVINTTPPAPTFP
jgi:hypothetical protein